MCSPCLFDICLSPAGFGVRAWRVASRATAKYLQALSVIYRTHTVTQGMILHKLHFILMTGKCLWTSTSNQSSTTNALRVWNTSCTSPKITEIRVSLSYFHFCPEKPRTRLFRPVHYYSIILKYHRTVCNSWQWNSDLCIPCNICLSTRFAVVSELGYSSLTS